MKATTKTYVGLACVSVAVLLLGIGSASADGPPSSRSQECDISASSDEGGLLFGTVTVSRHGTIIDVDIIAPRPAGECYTGWFGIKPVENGFDVSPCYSYSSLEPPHANALVLSEFRPPISGWTKGRRAMFVNFAINGGKVVPVISDHAAKQPFTLPNGEVIQVPIGGAPLYVQGDDGLLLPEVVKSEPLELIFVQHKKHCTTFGAIPGEKPRFRSEPGTTFNVDLREQCGNLFEK